MKKRENFKKNLLLLKVLVTKTPGLNNLDLVLINNNKLYNLASHFNNKKKTFFSKSKAKKKSIFSYQKKNYESGMINSEHPSIPD